MTDNFEQSFGFTIGHEGGYVNDPQDPGGETKFGISKRAYPDEDIEALGLVRAKGLYRRDYWNRARCTELPGGIDFAVFDFAFNAGVKTAVECLQETVGAIPDGIFGPNTMRRVWQEARDWRGRYRTLEEFHARRIEHYMSLRLGLVDRFGLGWSRRVMTAFSQSLIVGGYMGVEDTLSDVVE